MGWEGPQGVVGLTLTDEKEVVGMWTLPLRVLLVQFFKEIFRRLGWPPSPTLPTKGEGGGRFLGAVLIAPVEKGAH